MHKRNFRFLTAEMVKIMKDLIPVLVKEMFSLNEKTSYKILNLPGFTIQLFDSIRTLLESLSYLGSKKLGKVALRPEAN